MWRHTWRPFNWVLQSELRMNWAARVYSAWYIGILFKAGLWLFSLFWNNFELLKTYLEQLWWQCQIFPFLFLFWGHVLFHSLLLKKILLSWTRLAFLNRFSILFVLRTNSIFKKININKKKIFFTFSKFFVLKSLKNNNAV